MNPTGPIGPRRLDARGGRVLGGGRLADHAGRLLVRVAVTGLRLGHGRYDSTRAPSPASWSYGRHRVQPAALVPVPPLRGHDPKQPHGVRGVLVPEHHHRLGHVADLGQGRVDDRGPRGRRSGRPAVKVNHYPGPAARGFGMVAGVGPRSQSPPPDPSPPRALRPVGGLRPRRRLARAGSRFREETRWPTVVRI